MAINKDLKAAFDAIMAKRSRYDQLWRYYDGEHPVTYLASKLHTLFKGIDAVFTQNWCEVVINAALDRLNLDGFTISDNDEAQARLGELWRALQLNLEADETHEAALVIGEAFMLVWKDEEDNTQAYFNDPRLCHVFYKADNPREKAYAAKMWKDAVGGMRMQLYYPDRFEYFASSRKFEQAQDARGLFPLREALAIRNTVETLAELETAVDVAPNERNVIPVFHFRVKRRKVRGDLESVVPVQDAYTKLLNDMMVSAETGAFPQRYVISNTDTSQLKSGSANVWDLPSGDGLGQPTQVGQFSATDLGNYISAMDSLAASVASISRTPKHYFAKQGGDPSGEALLAMEAPLNKRVEDHIERFAPTWVEVAAFILALEGVEVIPAEIKPNYKPPQTVLPLTRAQIRKAEVDTGIPLITALRREGWTDAEVEQMNTDKEEESKRGQASFAAAMLNAQRGFDQGQQVGAN